MLQVFLIKFKAEIPKYEKISHSAYTQKLLDLDTISRYYLKDKKGAGD
jgi:hypothetical protein